MESPSKISNGVKKNQIVVIAVILVLILGGIIFSTSLTKEKPGLEGEKFEGQSFTTQGEGE